MLAGHFNIIMTPTITAKIIQDSIAYGTRLTTFELEYPRFIHAELMTHRVFSRNSASSRAIPIERMLHFIETTPACPLHWGQNQSGMQADQEVEDSHNAKEIWQTARDMACTQARLMLLEGIHKQVANRLTEPFQTIKVVVTATEWQNWYELRNHRDAQPEIRELAHQMQLEHASSQPLELQPGDWHVPYVDRVKINSQIHYEAAGERCDRTQARMVSASCCAQVSYRRLDQSLEKALQIAQRLVSGRPWHASPFEHQARPLHSLLPTETWEAGVTHRDRHGNLWSGNFRNWIQHRQLLEAV